MAFAVLAPDTATAALHLARSACALARSAWALVAGLASAAAALGAIAPDMSVSALATDELRRAKSSAVAACSLPALSNAPALPVSAPSAPWSPALAWALVIAKSACSAASCADLLLAPRPVVAISTRKFWMLSAKPAMAFEACTATFARLSWADATAAWADK